MILKTLAAGAVVLAAAAAGPALADCSALHTAKLKSVNAPRHLYQSETAAFTGGKPRLGEMIVTGNQMFLQMRGAWRKVPYDAKSAIADLEQNFKTNTLSCTTVGTETINGERAIHYHVLEKSPESTNDSNVWISTARGLPLQENEIQVDDGAKVQRSIRYDYVNVRPPPGL